MEISQIFADGFGSKIFIKNAINSSIKNIRI
jgi:hypothetical protein